MNSILPIQRQAATAGAAALEQIRRKQDASVIGVTSAGVFVQVESRRVIFLSEGNGRGPLSIYIGYIGNACPELKEGLKPGMAVRCEGRKISFPQTGLEVSCAGLKGWTAPKPIRPASPYDFQGTRLDTLAYAAVRDRKLRGISSLLPEILSMDLDALEFEPLESGLLDKVEDIDRALVLRDAEQTLKAFAPFYGLGPGLTPSGDDFIIGILLILSRWTPPGWIEDELEQLRQGVVERAFRSTTALSASLIECAAGGQADERLIKTADHIACGKPGQDESLAGLLSWGASSGLDTLTGMAVIFRSAAQG